jgi:hypothetical protein
MKPTTPGKHIAAQTGAILDSNARIRPFIAKAISQDGKCDEQHQAVVVSNQTSAHLGRQSIGTPKLYRAWGINE